MEQRSSERGQENVDPVEGGVVGQDHVEVVGELGQAGLHVMVQEADGQPRVVVGPHLQVADGVADDENVAARGGLVAKGGGLEPDAALVEGVDQRGRKAGDAARGVEFHEVGDDVDVRQQQSLVPHQFDDDI